MRFLFVISLLPCLAVSQHHGTGDQTREQNFPPSFQQGFPFRPPPGLRNSPPPLPSLFAVCQVLGPSVTGTIELIQDFQRPMVMSGTIQGLTPGKHGFHIHEFGNVGDNCKSAGGHFNPLKFNHGAPEDVERHVGDLGNIISDDLGVAKFNKSDFLVSIPDVLGRAIVIHAGEDDLGRGTGADKEGSLSTGNAGGRVGCCTIAIDKPRK